MRVSLALGLVALAGVGLIADAQPALEKYHVPITVPGCTDRSACVKLMRRENLVYANGVQRTNVVFRSYCKEPVFETHCFGRASGQPTLCGGSLLEPGAQIEDVGFDACDVVLSASPMNEPDACRNQVREFRCAR